MVIDWYSNKAYQCPRCRHDTVAAPSAWEVYTCCNCSTRFARFPRLERFLRHVGITCKECTKQRPVLVDGEPYGFLRRRHSGMQQYRFEAWLYDPDEYRDGVRYLNTRGSRAEAIADLAWWHSTVGPGEDDPRPVLAVAADENFSKYGPETTDEQRAGFLSGALEVYGVGILRPYTAPHPLRGRFHPDAFTWGLIAPGGLEGIYTMTAGFPEPLTAHTPFPG